jgi:hypothetical protein
LIDGTHLVLVGAETQRIIQTRSSEQLAPKAVDDVPFGDKIRLPGEPSRTINGKAGLLTASSASRSSVDRLAGMSAADFFMPIRKSNSPKATPPSG